MMRLDLTTLVLLEYLKRRQLAARDDPRPGTRRASLGRGRPPASRSRRRHELVPAAGATGRGGRDVREKGRAVAVVVAVVAVPAAADAVAAAAVAVFAVESGGDGWFAGEVVVVVGCWCRRRVIQRRAWRRRQWRGHGCAIAGSQLWVIVILMASESKADVDRQRRGGYGGGGGVCLPNRSLESTSCGQCVVWCVCLSVAVVGSVAKVDGCFSLSGKLLFDWESRSRGPMSGGASAGVVYRCGPATKPSRVTTPILPHLKRSTTTDRRSGCRRQRPWNSECSGGPGRETWAHFFY